MIRSAKVLLMIYFKTLFSSFLTYAPNINKIKCSKIIMCEKTQFYFILQFQHIALIYLFVRNAMSTL